ncbi:class I SAM-dependent methyltransferase [Phyllobacterium sp. 0TCS1.6C]|uniref:class I SAM-dependent methyltransferase n=1 Tax=unclassified Phyllobacterium TaxID=2638441 RepID=UPI0022642640|nr:MULTISPECIES: class I SAM-dependent methyltransferase [unclassified Phyllobacterium]MCX8279302.1 class I SAM-dependent methyltransferase [Phyllobacterium sp. 0TCS1.6C]MCX8294086.1 class I SAM-dependent methyltransferase [Phyllobacterium sp. 0TCS1.6A]
MAWSYGYYTDLNYSYGYYSEMNPAMLRLACLGQAAEPQLREKPIYLELGFGQGVSINMHAAGSAGSYWGTDFNPTQTVEARRLAAASGADLRLFDDSFEELSSRNDLPDFDIIALHGIWSWISEANRKIIVDIIRRKLRPGGIAYISYNCLPGWAPVIPIRELLSLYQDYGDGIMSGPVGMIEGALKFSADIAKAGSIYFQENPVAGQHLEHLMKQGRNYLAHEFLNADWHLGHFSDMVRSLEDAKLSFVGSASLLSGVDALRLSETGRKLVAQIGHPIMRETVRDYLLNRRFRSDIFIKGPRKLSDSEHRDAWHAQVFVLLKPIADIPKKIPCGRGEVELPTEKYDPVIEALSDDGYRPKRVDELLRHPKLQRLEPKDVVEVLTVLTGAGFMGPAQQPSQKVIEQCRALNRHILERALVGMDLHHMASPVTGGGIAMPHMTQLFIRAWNEGRVSPDSLADYVWDFLDSIGERLLNEGSRIESKDENLKQIGIAASKFLKFELPLLEALQIVEPSLSGEIAMRGAMDGGAGAPRMVGEAMRLS